MAAAADRPPASAPAPCLKLVDTGPLRVQYTGQFPDNLKLIKTLPLPLPLRLTGAAFINPRTQKFGYSVSCKETLLGGNISYIASRHALGYRKAVALPSLPQAVLVAEWPVGQHWRRTRVRLGLGYSGEEGSGDVTMADPGTFAFRRTGFVLRRIGLEATGALRVGLEDVVSTGLSGLRADVALQQLNLVYRL